jgi:hypothetical protein
VEFTVPIRYPPVPRIPVWWVALLLQHLPREVTAFEIEAFYQFSAEECRVIEERSLQQARLTTERRVIAEAA